MFQAMRWRFKPAMERRCGMPTSDAWGIRRLRISSMGNSTCYSGAAVHCSPSHCREDFRMKKTLAILLFATFTLRAAPAPVRVMILDGESGGAYHKTEEHTS